MIKERNIKKFTEEMERVFNAADSKYTEEERNMGISTAHQRGHFTLLLNNLKKYKYLNIFPKFDDVWGNVIDALDFNTWQKIVQNNGIVVNNKYAEGCVRATLKEINYIVKFSWNIQYFYIELENKNKEKWEAERVLNNKICTERCKNNKI